MFGTTEMKNLRLKASQLDFSDRQVIQKYQNEQLCQLLEYLQANSGFYRNLFQVNDIRIDKIQSVADLKYIPTTTKRDIQLYNWDFLCVNKAKIVEYTSTSGTLGAPVIIPLTKRDLNRLAYNEALSYSKMQITEHNVIQLALTLDKQFMAGMAYYQGSHLFDAAVVRTGPGVPSMQWDTIFRLNTSTIVAVPSFIVKLIEYAEQNHIDYKNSPLKKALCIGENVRTINLELNPIGQRINSKWNLELYSTYASSEMQTAFTECACGCGGHQHSELVIIEVLDDYGNAVNTGELGELVITTLGIEGMPLLRYQTGDLCYIIDEPCACGRNSLRISPIAGRKSHMVKLKGTTLYPPMIFESLNARDEIDDYVVVVSSNDLGTDHLVIHIAFKDNVEENIAKTIESYLHATLRVRPDIVVTDTASIMKMQANPASRKTNKFIDTRKSTYPF